MIEHDYAAFHQDYGLVTDDGCMLDRGRRDNVQNSTGKRSYLGGEVICTYLLPIRRTGFCEAEVHELAEYFGVLRAAGCEVLVVDGSDQAIFRRHSAVWDNVSRHIPVDRRFGFLNDKVNGIYTGVHLASDGKIVLADDDIRYGPQEIRIVTELLNEIEVVRPQNFFFTLPWWARWESGRMLINRATLRTGDYPGTCAFCRSTFLAAGRYDGDVLFDNEEMIRHLVSVGASICYATDLFVRKKPPSFAKWLEQRPRQAYEDFPLRLKTALFASVLPAGVLLLWKIKVFWLLFSMAAIAFATILLARMGRARGNAEQYFPVSLSFYAPLWVAERAISTYWAFGWRVLRGGYPFGGQLLKRGVGRAWFDGRPRPITRGVRSSPRSAMDKGAGRGKRLSRNFNV